MDNKNQWLEWAKELQFLSQSALAYCRDKYDIERFERIRAISAEMAATVADMPFETVKDLFCGDSGYQTAKLDTRAAVMREGKLLMVQEGNGQWTLPGGWVDYNKTVYENTVKEVREEAGMAVRPVRLIALHEHNKRNTKPYLFNIVSAFVLCEYVSGEFKPNIETIACGFFAPDALPTPLADDKATAAQIDMCFRAAANDGWRVEFD